MNTVLRDMEEDWNRPSRTDHYIMQLTYYLKNWSGVKNFFAFKIPFMMGFTETEKIQTEEEVKEKNQSMAASAKAAMAVRFMATLGKNWRKFVKETPGDG